MSLSTSQWKIEIFLWEKTGPGAGLAITILCGSGFNKIDDEYIFKISNFWKKNDNFWYFSVFVLINKMMTNKLDINILYGIILPVRVGAII